MDEPSRVRDGTISDLNVCTSDPDAKILSATGFPLTGTSWNIGKHSTDYVAWRATQRMPYAIEDIPLPTSDFALGNAATEGAVLWWRFSPHGLGTVFKVKTGGIILSIGRPNSSHEPCDSHSYGEFGIANLLQNFSETDVTKCNWLTEKIYLGPCTEL